MDNNVKREWVAALRSKDYDQGMNTMCEADDFGASYCPLGVLVEVVEGEDIWVEIPEPECASKTLRPINQNEGPYNQTAGAFPSLEFLDKVKLSLEDASWISELNDVLGLRFPDLAKIIEKSNL
jgi:hypothetical protein